MLNHAIKILFLTAGETRGESYCRLPPIIPYDKGMVDFTEPPLCVTPRCKPLGVRTLVS